MARGSPKMCRAASGARQAATMAHTAVCPRFHAVLASAPAMASTTRMKVSGCASAPPTERGSSSRNSPASSMASSTGPGILRSRSISSAAAAISGARARTRSR